jgi:hypothetical protein
MSSGRMLITNWLINIFALLLTHSCRSLRAARRYSRQCRKFSIFEWVSFRLRMSFPAQQLSNRYFHLYRLLAASHELLRTGSAKTTTSGSYGKARERSILRHDSKSCFVASFRAKSQPSGDGSLARICF